MDADRLIGSLERFVVVLPAAVAGISLEDARWKPADGAWSILEIVRHLGDEEVEDFRTRVRMTLETPERDWPATDPEGWAKERKYNEGDLADAVERFAGERRESVKWLRGLSGPDWNSERRHPEFGAMKAGELLGAWAAHDALHLRQIAKRIYQMAQRDAGEFDVGYAGEWKA